MASIAVCGLLAWIWSHHPDALLVLGALFVLLLALKIQASTQQGLAPSQHHQVLCQVVENIECTVLKQLVELVPQAFMLRELSSVVVTVADLALNHDFRALALDMLKQFCPCHVLEFFLVANVTAEFGAVEDGVLLQLSHCLPNQGSVPSILEAAMGKFSEVNALL